MGRPAARVTDMHTCPMVTPGTPPIPHVGGPIIPACSPNVITGGLPQARVTDKAVCVGPMDMIVQGSVTVFVNGLPAARMGDPTVHGGVIVTGQVTVLIGDKGESGGGGVGKGYSPPTPSNSRMGTPSTSASAQPSSNSGARPSPVAPTLSASHAPKFKKALSLIRIGGSADQNDAELVATELIKMSDADLDRMKVNGSTVVICRGSVTDYKSDLKGVQPRGWPVGKSWDIVPGLHDPSKKEVVIATIGHGTSLGARVPKTGEGHGSANLVLHEVAHALDMDGTPPPLNKGKDFQAARNLDLSGLTSYEKQQGEAGLQESFAEGFARSIENISSQQPNLDKYFRSRK